MQNAILTTAIDLVLKQVDESTSSASIPEAIGVITMQIQSLCIKLNKPPGDQDAGALVQNLRRENEHLLVRGVIRIRTTSLGVVG